MKGVLIVVFVAVAVAAGSYEVIEEDICCLPNVTGLCKAYMPRWFYNVECGACESFIYGGCGGNKNNFLTKCDCQESCGDKDDICCLPKKVGPCRGAFRRWFYNSTTDSCEFFLYGGCEGNQNNFLKQCQCERQCL